MRVDLCISLAWIFLRLFVQLFLPCLVWWLGAEAWTSENAWLSIITGGAGALLLYFRHFRFASRSLCRLKAQPTGGWLSLYALPIRV